MAASTATAWVGALLAFCDIEDGFYIDMVEIVSIDGPDVTSETADVTHTASPTLADSSQVYREKIATLGDAGSISFTANFIPASHEAQVFEAVGVKQWYRITGTDAVPWVFRCEGIITSCKITGDKTTEYQLSGTIELSGVPAYSP